MKTKFHCIRGLHSAIYVDDAMIQTIATKKIFLIQTSFQLTHNLFPAFYNFCTRILERLSKNTNEIIIIIIMRRSDRKLSSISLTSFHSCLIFI